MMAAPANDLFANRIIIGDYETELAIDMTQATKETNEPVYGGGIFHTAWYEWTCPDPAPGQMRMDSVNNASLAFRAYTGSWGALVQVESHYRDLTLVPVTGTTYYLQVGRYTSTTVPPTTLRWRQMIEAPGEWITPEVRADPCYFDVTTPYALMTAPSGVYAHTWVDASQTYLFAYEDGSSSRSRTSTAGAGTQASVAPPYSSYPAGGFVGEVTALVIDCVRMTNFIRHDGSLGGDNWIRIENESPYGVLVGPPVVTGSYGFTKESTTEHVEGRLMHPPVDRVQVDGVANGQSIKRTVSTSFVTSPTPANMAGWPGQGPVYLIGPVGQEQWGTITEYFSITMTPDQDYLSFCPATDHWYANRSPEVPPVGTSSKTSSGHLYQVIVNALYQQPRYRFIYETFPEPAPVDVMAPPLKLTQRDDGLGMQGHARLDQVGQPPSSAQLARTPRLGQGNTYDSGRAPI